jgi:hypothetical protein
LSVLAPVLPVSSMGSIVAIRRAGHPNSIRQIN